MIKAADLLFRAPKADKPTILLLIDRNELEDQMLKNLAALGLGNLEHAGNIARLNQLLRDDYRGIIVTTIHKFRDMPASINTRTNIYILIDEAHRTTGGDLGNFLMAGFLCLFCRAAIAVAGFAGTMLPNLTPPIAVMPAAKNRDLHAAKKNKNDEFYTQLRVLYTTDRYCP